MKNLEKNWQSTAPFDVTTTDLNTQSRESLIEWLVWNDSNGCYTDEDSINEGYEPLTKEECIALFKPILEDIKLHTFCEELTDSNSIELACELAHDRTLYESGDICNNENDMYEDPTAHIQTYKDEIQDRFNHWYDYYLTKITKHKQQ